MLHVNLLLAPHEIMASIKELYALSFALLSVSIFLRWLQSLRRELSYTGHQIWSISLELRSWRFFSDDLSRSNEWLMSPQPLTQCITKHTITSSAPIQHLAQSHIIHLSGALEKMEKVATNPFPGVDRSNIKNLSLNQPVSIL